MRDLAAAKRAQRIRWSVSLAVVAALGAGGGAFAATMSSGDSYREVTAGVANVDGVVDLVGTLQPVSEATVAFQVAGTVASTDVAVGAVVSANQTLATLDATALNQAVDSAQSQLSSAQSKLGSDEASEDAAATKTATGTSTTTTTSPSRNSNSGGSPTSSTGGGSPSQISQDQNEVVADQNTLDTDIAQANSDLSNAQSTCQTSSGSSSCETALATVQGDQQKVQADETQLDTDENSLGSALSAAASSSSAPSATTTTIASSSGTNPSSQSGSSYGKSTNALPGPAEIASDEAAIDGDRAALITAQQSAADTTLVSPIAGTVVADTIATGSVVSSNSSTDTITVLGQKVFEVTGTLTSANVSSVHDGQRAQVAVDGLSSPLVGTVTQVGPINDDDGSFVYPVIVTLPAATAGVFDGANAEVAIITSSAHGVLTVATSAVHTIGARSYVLENDNGTLVEHRVVVGLVGNERTQITSGLKAGAVVVLADDGEAIPTSNTNTFGGFGGAGGGGFSRFSGAGPGGTAVRITAPA